MSGKFDASFSTARMLIVSSHTAEMIMKCLGLKRSLIDVTGRYLRRDLVGHDGN